jgi:hypothetical protein
MHQDWQTFHRHEITADFVVDCTRKVVFCLTYIPFYYICSVRIKKQEICQKNILCDIELRNHSLSLKAMKIAKDRTNVFWKGV